MPGCRALAVAALVLASAVVFALPVGRRPLYNQDEVRYAMLAREVVEKGHWFLPRVRNEVYLNKPPLFFWTVALFSLPTGRVSDVTAPLVSVAAAVAGVLGVYTIGRRLWGHQGGFVAAAVLAAMPFYFFMAHQVLTDMMLTAWLVWALSFYLRLADREGGRGAWWGFYLCTAGALSTKGPVALVALVAAVGASLAAEGRAGLRVLRLPWGLGLVALTTLPWLVPYVLLSERSYTESVLVTDYLAWYFRAEAADSRLAAVFAYLAGCLPWALLIPLMVVWWWRGGDGRRRRLVVWTTVFVVAVLLSGIQRSRYFLPALPPLALLVAEFFVRAPAALEPRGRRLVLGGSIAFLVLALAMLGAALLAPAGVSVRGGDWVYLPVTMLERGLMGGFLVAGALAAVVAVWRGGSGMAVATCWALAIAAALGLEGIGYPARYAEWYDVRTFAEKVHKAHPSAALIAYPDANLAFDFYLRRSIREVKSPDAIYVIVARPATPDALLIREDRWAWLRGSADPSWQPVATGVVAGRPFVLLGNHE